MTLLQQANTRLQSRGLSSRPTNGTNTLCPLNVSQSPHTHTINRYLYLCQVTISNHKNAPRLFVLIRNPSRQKPIRFSIIASAMCNSHYLSHTILITPPADAGQHLCSPQAAIVTFPSLPARFLLLRHSHFQTLISLHSHMCCIKFVKF